MAMGMGGDSFPFIVLVCFLSFMFLACFFRAAGGLIAIYGSQTLKCWSRTPLGMLKLTLAGNVEAGKKGIAEKTSSPNSRFYLKSFDSFIFHEIRA
ncbi:uncharacterized protein LY79DRAFT_573827 [Colletotrichum navitas]|uniref:Uncharacterized protein n=1 Tax=Colletotrichum navitas TaxID=681940 RepID=A0AAD8UX14_9PEZI|nr:uncharacterized protein LY79DRAFT_573827 [Colletotrichum navitas]KAK1563995.1 hypothetical protein LY79DRAFT_573827 [Colletotrichum navitas]